MYITNQECQAVQLLKAQPVQLHHLNLGAQQGSESTTIPKLYGAMICRVRVSALGACKYYISLFGALGLTRNAYLAYVVNSLSL